MGARAFIFDMDGTLVDNMRWHMQTWFQLGAELGLTLEEGDFHTRLAGRTNEAIFAALLGEAITPAEATRRGEEKEARYRELYAPHQAPIAGLVELLVAARGAGVHLAVATSADPPNIDFTLDGCDLRRRFEVVVGGREVARAKPEPDLFLEAARRLGVEPAACTVFEDTRSGLEAARRAGMRAVAISTSLDRPTLAALPGVGRVIEDYRGLTVESLVRFPA
jgi:beta-phosphoglucomutase family hydrolase